ncbi:radical SAM protein [candidate division WOR-3 bacterium]|nr:radical SAM protein [candidate division WOR-3 bacterium]
MGGIHPTLYPEETIAFPEIDYCVIGEGKNTFIKLLENLNDFKELKKTKGLIFKQDNQIINTGKADEVENLDLLPFPALHLTPVYTYRFSLMRSPFTTMITSRGCPYHCIFCDREKLGNVYRVRSAENVVDEMEYYYKTYGIRDIYFQDNTFTVNKNRVIEICKEIRRRKFTFRWGARARTDTVDAELLSEMKSAGCERLDIGVESGCQEILDKMRKGITIEQIRNALITTNRAGIKSLAYFIIGMPYESREQMLQTIRFARELKSDFAVFTRLVPLPATQIYENAVKDGVIEDYWKEFAKSPQTNFSPKTWHYRYSDKEVTNLVRRAYKSYYLNPNFILKRLFSLRDWHQFKMQIKVGVNMLHQ